MRTTLASLAFILAVLAQAQCGMTTSLTLTPIYCTQMRIAYDVNTTGGTPPFNIFLEKLDSPVWHVILAGGSDADGDLFGGHIDNHMVASVRVTVTDALNCTATSTADVNPLGYGGGLHYVSLVQDACSGNAMIRFQPTSSPGDGSCSVASHTLSVLNTTTNITVQVPMSTGCTAEAGGYYRTVQLFPPGSYSINFNNMTSCGPIECWYPGTCTIGDVSGYCGANLRVRACLAGGLTTGSLLGDGLRAAGLVPIIEPYSAISGVRGKS